MDAYIHKYIFTCACVLKQKYDSAVHRNQLLLMFLFSKTKTESSLTGTFLLCSTCHNGQLDCTGVPGRWLLAVHCHCGRWEAEVIILKIS